MVARGWYVWETLPYKDLTIRLINKAPGLWRVRWHLKSSLAFGESIDLRKVRTEEFTGLWKVPEESKLHQVVCGVTVCPSCYRGLSCIALS